MNPKPLLKWQCSMCGEILDEARGLPDEGIPPGTRLADLPDDWICPSCGAGKSSYVLMQD